MAALGYLALCLLVLATSVEAFNENETHLPWPPTIISCDPHNELNRGSFPRGFVFGASSSSYQYEGAYDEGGKGPHIWDTFTEKYPGAIIDHTNGKIAADSYHRHQPSGKKRSHRFFFGRIIFEFLEVDVEAMKFMGLDAYRFQIEWSRILPSIEPFVNLFHFTVPQPLEDDYGGFRDRQIVKDFQDFAEVCFKEFGPLVKHWTTFNAPKMFSEMGYARGTWAPGRCSGCIDGGNSGAEPYLVTHHVLLAHAAVVKLYREQNFQQEQKGEIGIILDSSWMVPYSSSEPDNVAASRALDFAYGWFMDPLTYGHYPESMQVLVGERLPKFSQNESHMIIGSFDFIGINYFTTKYAKDANVTMPPNYVTDSRVNLSYVRNGVPIGSPFGTPPLCAVYPPGIFYLLNYTKENYENPPIYITGNGVGAKFNESTTFLDAITDKERVDYHHDHLCFVRLAMNPRKHGVKVKGYFVWTLLDAFEWDLGFTARFGTHYVDYEDRSLTRYPKLSAIWFKKFLQRSGMVLPPPPLPPPPPPPLPKDISSKNEEL
ncbi:unnamed protein product [Ilex paraguariensis]|uniref:Beta-glucosidase n=1 Tax=Ilex paraguariensis TaxID=185542 RepID=A0ABC8UTV7_9AQUA